MPFDPSNPSIPDVDQTLDLSLFDEPIDLAAIDKIKRDAQPPAGHYVSQTPLTATVFKGDDQRRVALFSGVFTNDDDGAQHRLRVRISPDRRDRDDTQKPDMASRLWVQVRDAFKQATGVEPTTERQLMEYLANYPVRVRIMQGDDSPIVLSIRAVGV